MATTFHDYKSKEYWALFYLAEYQWKTGRSFKDIFYRISLSEIIDMYHPYHEMDENRFVEDMEELILRSDCNTPTSLASIRTGCGISQSELAKISGVNTKLLQYAITIILAIFISLFIKIVGVLLISALMIIPVSASILGRLPASGSPFGFPSFTSK